MSTDSLATDGRVRRQSWQDVLPDNLLVHVALVASTLVMALPLLLALLMSTQTTTQIYQTSNLAPGGQAVHNYVAAMTEYGMGRYLLNSLVMSLVIVVGKVTISLFAALAIVYYRFRFKRLVFMFILFTLMLPVPVRILSLFQFVANIGWSDSLLALTAPYLASATTVFLLRQHFRSIPDSLVETARLDGIGPLTFLFRVLVPMSKGMIAGVAVIEFIYAWNQYLWPLTIMSTQRKQVAQVGVKLLQSASAAGQTQWGLIMAGAVIALIPPLLVLLVLHRPLLQTFGLQQK